METLKEKQKRYADGMNALLSDASLMGLSITVQPEDISIVGDRVRALAHLIGDATLTLEISESALSAFLAFVAQVPQ